MEVFTPTDLCGLIAHETAALLYGSGTAGFSSAEKMRSGLEVFAAAAGVTDINAYLAWIGSEMVSAQEFERTGLDVNHMLDQKYLDLVPDAATQMEVVWELFNAAVRMPCQRDRQAMKDMVVILADEGGLTSFLLDAQAPTGPYLTVSKLREELENVRNAFQTHMPPVVMLP